MRYSARCAIIRRGSTKKAVRDVNDEPMEAEAGVRSRGMGEESDLQAGRCVFGGLPFFANGGVVRDTWYVLRVACCVRGVSEAARRRGGGLMGREGLWGGAMGAGGAESGGADVKMIGGEPGVAVLATCHLYPGSKSRMEVAEWLSGRGRETSARRWTGPSGRARASGRRSWRGGWACPARRCSDGCRAWRRRGICTARMSGVGCGRSGESASQRVSEPASSESARRRGGESARQRGSEVARERGREPTSRQTGKSADWRVKVAQLLRDLEGGGCIMG